MVSSKPAGTLDGKQLRKVLARDAQKTLALPARRDPVGILEQQHTSRLADLVPVRIGRMLQSPFTYYRGTAAVMAADLADAPSTGLSVVSCGDAHISNFGFFASPERTLLFDLNDFDEAGVSPWEWDVKRLAASVYIGGRDLGLSETACREAATKSVASYRKSLRAQTQLCMLDRYFYQIDSSVVEQQLADESGSVAARAARKARQRTSAQVLQKITLRGKQGKLRIIDQPPVTRHVRHASLAQLNGLFQQYLGTVREDVAYLLSQYTLVDYVLRVVGVGSVGTRCYVLAFEGPHKDVLFLQAKEAQASVLTSYGKMPATVPGDGSGRAFSEGHRVVAAQRILQAQSDPFLGHIVGFAGEKGDRPRVDYYWRQFRDMKGSIDTSVLNSPQFAAYGKLCGKLLARAHSQSPQADAVAQYLGDGDVFEHAIAQWSAAYADVVEADYAQLQKAVKSGRLPAELNV